MCLQRVETSSAKHCMKRESASASTKLLGLNVGTLHPNFTYRQIDIGADAFIRDELSKGRYDPYVSKICFEMLLELFSRTLRSDLGPRAGGEQKVENVC